MDPICLNCEHFEIKSMPVDKYIWGNCKRPGLLSIDSNDGAFAWADKTCSYFKPKQTKNIRKSTSKESADAQESTDR